jgi:ATP-binding cassette subfamily F protein uup
MAARARATEEPRAEASAARPRKLGYREQRELDALPDRIEALEQEQKRLGALLADGALYAREPATAARAQARWTEVDAELRGALERWETLASQAQGSA